MELQNLGWFSRRKHTKVQDATTSAGTTNVLAPVANTDSHIATLTNVNGSDLKIVGTEEGSVKVDEVHNDGTTTFTSPSKETDVPSAVVAVIVDTKTGKTVAKIETKAENVP